MTDKRGDERADYPLPPSDGINIKEEYSVTSDWKEKKIASYRKKSDTSPLMKPFEEGTILHGRYGIIEKIYGDTNRVLYKIKDLKEEDKLRKIKFLREIQYISDEEDMTVDDRLQRLEKITSFLLDIDHPNLARIYDYFSLMEENNGSFCIVMEFIEGDNLEELLRLYTKEGTALPLKTVFAIMEKLCDALNYLHSKEPFPIGFGDLKPSNIILADGSIKFINYGTGSFFDAEEEGNIPDRGTLGYVAPEDTGSGIPGTKADIFSLGVTVYYMLTGVNPEEHPYEFKPLRKHKRFVSEKVQHFINRCLEVNPDKRPDINAVKKLMEKMDLQELDLSSLLKKKEEEIKTAEEPEEETPWQPPAISQEKVEEIITDFKVKNPFIISRYGILSIIILLVTAIYFITISSNYISRLPRWGNKILLSSPVLSEISELDLDSYKFSHITSLPGNCGPIVYSKKKRILYAVGTKDGYLYEISIDNGKILRKLKVGSDAIEIIISPDENIMYILKEGSNTMSFIDLQMFKESRSTVGLIVRPLNMCLSHGGDKLFICKNEDESVAFFDTGDNIITGNIAFMGKKPLGIAADKNKLYVCLSYVNKLAIIDIKTASVDREVSVKAEPVKVLVSPAEKKICILYKKASALEIFETDNFKQVRNTTYLSFQPENAVFSPDGKYLYIVGGNTLTNKKNFLLGIYDISSGNIRVLNCDYPVKFLIPVKL